MYISMEILHKDNEEKGISIIPLCPFAKSVFDKVPEFSDVL